MTRSRRRPIPMPPPSEEYRCPFCGETRAIDTWSVPNKALELYCHVCGRISGGDRPGLAPHPTD